MNWLAFLARYQLHGILCDDMGLGKTLQALCILASDHYHRSQAFQVCLPCFYSAVQWYTSTVIKMPTHRRYLR